jgi:hypothetical protein
MANNTVTVTERILTGRVARLRDSVTVSLRILEQEKDLVQFQLERKIIMLDELKTPLVTEASWPRDWWEAFKERWFSWRMLQRWPVKRTFLRRSDTPAIVNLAILPDRDVVMIRTYDQKEEENNVVIPNGWDGRSPI